MQISNIKGFVASLPLHFKSSSWQGRSVRILCAISFLSLIYWVAFCLKKETKPPSRIKNPTLGGFKTDPSYIKIVTQEPEFLKSCLNEFGVWLAEKIETSEGWLKLAQGNDLQKVSSLRALRTFLPDLKKEVEKRASLLTNFPTWTEGEWQLFANPNADALTSCNRLRAYLVDLQSWDVVWQSQEKAVFMEKLIHYEFTDLQQQYFHYLDLRTEQDFSCRLETQRPYLAEVGLLEMADIDILQLRALQPSLERLRQIISFANRGYEESMRPLLEQEVQKCNHLLDTLLPLLDVLKNDQDFSTNLNDLRQLFAQLSGNFADGLLLLDQIEQKDKERQLIQLKGYIHQQDHRKRWKELNACGISQLNLYAKVHDLKEVTVFYQLGLCVELE